jgi:hypothetical protein
MHAMPDLIAERARTAASAARPRRLDAPPDRVQERHIAWRHALMQERLVRALVARYPVTALMLGDPLFPGTARAFALEHPPRTPVLGEWGDAFPAFLAGFRPTEDVAFLPDVARIERAVWRALHAPDAPPMSHADLSVAALAQPKLLFLRLHPALGTVGSRHPALSIWSRRASARRACSAACSRSGRSPAPAEARADGTGPRHRARPPARKDWVHARPAPRHVGGHARAGHADAFVEHCNHHRYHESLGNPTTADDYFSRGERSLGDRALIKAQTILNRRLLHQKHAA